MLLAILGATLVVAGAFVAVLGGCALIAYDSEYDDRGEKRNLFILFVGGIAVGLIGVFLSVL